MQSACFKGWNYRVLLDRAKQAARAAEANACVARQLIELLEVEAYFESEPDQTYASHLDSYGAQRFINAPRGESLTH